MTGVASSNIRRLRTAFVPSGFFVLRSPLLPVDAWMQWSGQTRAAAASEAELRSALRDDRQCLTRQLQLLVEQAEIREAIFLASPDLDASLVNWQRNPRNERGLRVGRAVVKYFSRMSSRATPFGLFAGCSLGELGDITRLQLHGREHIRRHTRLDCEFLFGLARTLGKTEARRRESPLRVNSSLCVVSGRLQYVEETREGHSRTHKLVAVDLSPPLRHVIAKAEDGATSSELIEYLMSSEDVTEPEAASFIEELIESQILVAEPEVPLTGSEPLCQLVPFLRSQESTASIAAALESARNELADLDERGLGRSLEEYQRIAAILSATGAPVSPQRLFQVDIAKPVAEAKLGRRLVQDIMGAVSLLQFISEPRPNLLARLQQEFLERFGTREISVVEALDPDGGLGYILNDLGPDQSEPETHDAPMAPKTYRLKRRDRVLLGKITSAMAEGRLEIELSPEELIEETRDVALPSSFAAHVTLATEPGQAAELEGSLVLEGLTGPSGAIVLGRFCHMMPELLAHVREHLRAEEMLAPNAIFAEVVHAPAERLGNVLLRPILREYEIPYLGSSGMSPERQIPVSDLLVRLEGGRFVLRSKQLDREVIPCLTTAHNFWHPQCLPLYRFLCALPLQEGRLVTSWSWGLLESLPFLPRVRIGRVVLSRATWRLDKGEIRQIADSDDDEVMYQNVQSWRRLRHVPRHILVADGDNQLWFDLENILSIDALIHLLRPKESCVLREIYPSPNVTPVFGPDGRYAHELIVPFVRTIAGATGRSFDANRSDRQTAGGPAKSQRTFAPGSEWLYAKIYAGRAQADRILRLAVQPLIQNATGSGVVDKWFFIRYGDPKPHIRLRMHGSPSRLLGEALPALHDAIAPFLESGAVWQLQLDTYEREIERYGGFSSIDDVEEIFRADSEAVLSWLKCAQSASVARRCDLAVYGVHTLLSDFDVELGARVALLRQYTARHEKRELSERYRAERHKVVQVLESDFLPESWRDAIAKRSQIVRPIAKKFCRERASCQKVQRTDEILISLTHMHINRLFRWGDGGEEPIVYELLARYYQTRISRAMPELDMGADKQFRTSGPLA